MGGSTTMSKTAGRFCGFLLSRLNSPRIGASITDVHCYGSSLLFPSQRANYVSNFGRHNANIRLRLPSGTTAPSGAILPEPKRTRFGLLSVVTAVVTGLMIGATLSKLMANFLEEKELFVPSDEDDDDDDDD